ncbi:hypothetical protein QA609_00965 [Natronococcus sp. A-GB7]|nr:hypothetical protein [Natronococcus sp. A-GB7]MDG5817370.1 hypothetical protein [Natronococcus sp. A-GB7]
MPGGQSERILGECLACRSVYAAQQWADGAIKPIGAKNGCRCGSTEFRAIENPTLDGRQEEDPIGE